MTSVNIDYGYTCGRYWLKINGKVLAQTPDVDFWLEDDRVRELGITLLPECGWRNEIPAKPLPPPNRLVCDRCGDITATGKHTSWMCRFLEWVDKVEFNAF